MIEVEQIKRVSKFDVQFEHRVEINGKVLSCREVITRSQYDAARASEDIDEAIQRSLRAGIMHAIQKEIYDRT